MGYVTVAHYCYRGVLVEAELRLKALPRPRPDGVTLATRAAASNPLAAILVIWLDRRRLAGDPSSLSPSARDLTVITHS